MKKHHRRTINYNLTWCMYERRLLARCSVAPAARGWWRTLCNTTSVPKFSGIADLNIVSWRPKTFGQLTSVFVWNKTYRRADKCRTREWGSRSRYGQMRRPQPLFSHSMPKSIWNTHPLYRKKRKNLLFFFDIKNIIIIPF